MANGPEGEYEVVHDYVNARSAPSTRGRLLATLPRGTRLRAAPFRVGGEPWLQIAKQSLPAAWASRVEDEDAVWALADASATPLGLGVLLRRVEDSPSAGGSEQEATGGPAPVAGAVRVRCLSGAVYEVPVDCLWEERQLKAAVGKAAGVPSEEVRLLRGTEELSAEAVRELLWSKGGEGAELTLVRDAAHTNRPLRRDEWLRKIERDWRCLKDAPENIREDAEVVRLAVGQDWTALLHAAPELRGHRGVALAAVGTSWRAFEHIDAALRKDPELALAAARQSALALRWADDSVLGDRKVLMAAVKQQPELLGKASEELRGDRNVVLAAVKAEGATLRFAAPQLQADWQVVRTAVESDGRALEYACEVLRADRHVVLTAARQAPESLAHASPEAYEHPDVQLAAAAVTQCPDVLSGASEEVSNLHKVHDVVLAAVSRDGLLLRFAHANLRHDRDIVLAAVSQKGIALEFAAPDLQADVEVVLRAVQEDWHALEYASKDALAERSIVVSAASRSLEALKLLADSVSRHFWMDASIWGDPEVVQDLVAQDGRLLRYASPEVAKDREVVMAAVEQNWEAYKHTTMEIRQDRELALAIAPQHPDALLHLPDKFRADRKVVLEAVKAHGRALEHASPWLRKSRELVLAAVRQDPTALSFASPELQADREVLAAAQQQRTEPPKPKAAGPNRKVHEEPHEPVVQPSVQGGGKLGSVRMLDPEGEEGTYTGPLSAEGVAEGEGEFMYEDGERFVGQFVAGTMRMGVLYSQRTSRPRDTMRDGEWTPKIDARLVEAFPIHKASCQATLKATEEAARKAVQEKKAAKDDAEQKKAAERAKRLRKALEKRPLHRAVKCWRKAVTDRDLIHAFATWKSEVEWRAARRADREWKEKFFGTSMQLMEEMDSQAPSPPPHALAPAAAPAPAAALPAEEAGKGARQLWAVVGGEGRGGILARTLESTASPALPSRLATGATVEELALRGNRLRFRRLAGAGPDVGWVSVTFEGKALVRRLPAKA